MRRPFSLPMAIVTAAVLGLWAAPAAAIFVSENRSILVEASGQNRSFVIAYPQGAPAGLPLVISMHGDGGSGAGMRGALPLEGESGEGAIFVYPNAPGGTFEYFTDAGRTREVQFVRDLVLTLQGEFGIDPTRVFLAGFSGGATMANALGCRMEADEIRGLGIHSGSLYPEGGDFTYTGNGGVSCALPAAMLVWGMNDNTPGVNFSTGVSIRNNYLATHGCQAGTTPRDPSPCVDYAGCARDVAWCAIPNLGHAIWNGSPTQNAARAIWRFFAEQGPAPPPASTLAIFDEQLRNGWEDFSFPQDASDFDSTLAPRTGMIAIRFRAAAFNGVSFARLAQPVTTAEYPELRFWIRGAAGGESLSIAVESGGNIPFNLPLDSFITGGAVAAGAYREVRVRFEEPPVNYVGSFDRINIQDQSGNGAGNPQILDIDDVVLVGAGNGGGSTIFADGFE